MNKRYLIVAIFALAGCALPSTYQVPPDITPQTGASLTGIVKPMANIVTTGVHICASSIDGALPKHGFSQACDKPILLAPGMHTIEISVDFHPFPAETGLGTLTVSLDGGKAYFISATGGPVAFRNSNGQVSVPADEVTAWIESDTGVVVSDKIAIALRGPPPIPIFVPLK